MHIYFAGIDGVGLGPLALIARDMGHEVTGSDVEKTAYTWPFAELGIEVHVGATSEAIAKVHSENPIDWLVVTSALPADHPEIQFAKSHDIKVSKRDELLNQLIKQAGLKLIAVAGTHGKTTTTGMLIWTFQELGLPISYSIGTKINFGPGGKYDKNSSYFVYEADEFDRNFLHFKPFASIITSIDYDHPDTYPTKTNYRQAFSDFARQSHCNYLWSADAEALDLSLQGCLHKYGANENIDIIKLAGKHNRRNGFLVFKLMSDLFPEHKDKLIDIINRFPGTARRFEQIAPNLYSDYAHHPTEIKATIQLARELNKNVVAVYQPHQNIRQHEIRHLYKDAFRGVKKVYWLPTYLSREDPKLAVLAPSELIKGINKDTRVEICEMNSKLAQQITEHTDSGDLVVLMSAGNLDEWARKNFVEV